MHRFLLEHLFRAREPDEPDCFPPEIYPQILSHLPVKSLIRFRSVSKQWKSIIDDPYFARLHSNNRRRLDPPPLMVLDHIGLPPDCKIRCFSRSSSHDPPFYQQTSVSDPGNPHFKQQTPTVVGDAEGLLLYRLTRRASGVGELVLWNPSIRKRLIIPAPPSYPSSSLELELCLGFDPSTNDHKVVSMVPDEEDIIHLEIFSLASLSWRKGRSLTVGGDVLSLLHKVSKKISFKGCVHWIETTREPDRSYKELITLDLITETMSRFPLPSGPNQIFHYFYIAVVPLVVDGNSVGVLMEDEEASTSDIWVLESNGCWSKRFTLNIGDWNSDPLSPHFSKDGVLIWEHGYETLSICACDVNTGKISTVLQPPLGCRGCWKPVYFGDYIESLVLVNW